MSDENQNEDGKPTAEEQALAEKAAAEKAAAEKAAAEKAAGEEKAKPSDAEAKLLKEQMKTKERLRKAEEDAKTAAEKLAKYDGVDVEEYQKLKEAAAEAERSELERKGEYKRIIEQVKAESEKRANELEGQVKEMESAKSKLERQIERLTIGNSFGNSAFIRDKLVLSPNKVQALYGEHFDIVEGNLVAFDKPRGSEDRTRLVDGSGDPLSFESAIEKIVTSDSDFERIARSNVKPGANSNSTDDKGSEKAADKGPKAGLDRILAGLQARK
jgi:hypothetical protein